MFRDIPARENQKFIAGNVGRITRSEKLPTIVNVSVATKSGDDAGWVNVSFNNAVADTVEAHVTPGQFVAIVATEQVKGQYTNYYGNDIAFGPKSRKQQAAEQAAEG